MNSNTHQKKTLSSQPKKFTRLRKNKLIHPSNKRKQSTKQLRKRQSTLNPYSILPEEPIITTFTPSLHALSFGQTNSFESTPTPSVTASTEHEYIHQSQNSNIASITSLHSPRFPNYNDKSLFPQHIKSLINNARTNSTLYPSSQSFRSTLAQLNRRRLVGMRSSPDTNEFIQHCINDPTSKQYQEQHRQRQTQKLPFDLIRADCRNVKRSIRLVMQQKSPHIVSMFYNTPNSRKTRVDWVSMMCYLAATNSPKQLYLMLDNFFVQVCGLPPLIDDRLGFIRNQDPLTQHQQLSQYRNESELIRDAQEGNLRSKSLRYTNDDDDDDDDGDDGDSNEDGDYRHPHPKSQLELPALTPEQQVLADANWAKLTEAGVDTTAADGHNNTNDISPDMDEFMKDNQKSKESKVQDIPADIDPMNRVARHRLQLEANRPDVQFTRGLGSGATIGEDGKVKLVIDQLEDNSFARANQDDEFGSFDMELLHYETPEDEKIAFTKMQEEANRKVQVAKKMEQDRMNALLNPSWSNNDHNKITTKDDNNTQDINNDEADQLAMLMNLQKTQQSGHLDDDDNNNDGKQNDMTKSVPKKTKQIDSGELDETDAAFLKAKQQKQALDPLNELANGMVSADEQRSVRMQQTFVNMTQIDPKGVMNSYSISLILECLSGLQQHQELLTKAKGNKTSQNKSNQQSKKPKSKFNDPEALQLLKSLQDDASGDKSNNTDELGHDDSSQNQKLMKKIQTELLSLDPNDDLNPTKGQNSGDDNEKTDANVIMSGFDIFDEDDLNNTDKGNDEDDFFKGEGSKALIFLTYCLRHGLAVTPQCFDIVLRGSSLAIARDNYRSRLKTAVKTERLANIKQRTSQENDDFSDDGYDNDNDDDGDDGDGDDDDDGDDDNNNNGRSLQRKKGKTKQSARQKFSKDNGGGLDFIGWNEDKERLVKNWQERSQTRAQQGRIERLHETMLNRFGNTNGAKNDDTNPYNNDGILSRALHKAGEESVEDAILARNQRLLFETQQTISLMNEHKVYPSAHTWTYLLRAHFHRISTMSNQIEKQLTFKEQILPLYNQMVSTNAISLPSLYALATMSITCGQLNFFESLYSNIVALTNTTSSPLSPSSQQLVHAYRIITHVDFYTKNKNSHANTPEEIYSIVQDTLSNCDLSQMSPILSHILLRTVRTIPPTKTTLSSFQTLSQSLSTSTSLDLHDNLHYTKLQKLSPLLSPSQQKLLSQIYQYYRRPAALVGRNGTLTSTILTSKILFSHKVLLPVPTSLLQDDSGGSLRSQSSSSSSSPHSQLQGSSHISTSNIVHGRFDTSFTIAPLQMKPLSYHGYTKTVNLFTNFLNDLLDNNSPHSTNTTTDSQYASDDCSEAQLYTAILTHTAPSLSKDRKKPVLVTGSRADIFVPSTSLIIGDFLGYTEQSPSQSSPSHSTQQSSFDTRPPIDYDSANQIISSYCESLNSITNLFVDFRHKYSHFMHYQFAGGDASKADKSFTADLSGFLVEQDITEPFSLDSPASQRKVLGACLRLIGIDAEGQKFEKLKTSEASFIQKIMHQTDISNETTPFDKQDGTNQSNPVTKSEFVEFVSLFISDLISRGDLSGTSLMSQITDEYNTTQRVNFSNSAHKRHAQYHSRRVVDPKKRQTIEHSLRVLWRFTHSKMMEWCALTKATPYHMLASARNTTQLSFDTDLSTALPITETTISNLISVYLSLPSTTVNTPSYDKQHTQFMSGNSFGVKFAFQLLAYLDKSGHTITSQHLNTVLQFAHSIQDVSIILNNFSKFNTLLTTTASNNHISNTVRMLLLSFLQFNSPALFKQWAFAATQHVPNLYGQIHQQHIYHTELPSTYTSHAISRLQNSINHIHTHDFTDHRHKIDPNTIKTRHKLYEDVYQNDPTCHLELFNPLADPNDNVVPLDLQYFAQHGGQISYPYPINELETTLSDKTMLDSHEEEHSLHYTHLAVGGGSDFGSNGGFLKRLFRKTGQSANLQIDRDASFYESLPASFNSSDSAQIIPTKQINNSLSHIIENSFMVNYTNNPILQYLSVFANTHNNSSHDAVLNHMCVDLVLNNKILSIFEIDFVFTALKNIENINSFDGQLGLVPVYHPGAIRSRYMTNFSTYVETNHLTTQGPMSLVDVHNASNQSLANNLLTESLSSTQQHFNYYSTSETETDLYQNNVFGNVVDGDGNNTLADSATLTSQSTTTTSNSPKTSSAASLLSKKRSHNAHYYESIPIVDQDDLVPIDSWASNNYSDYLYGDAFNTPMNQDFVSEGINNNNINNTSSTQLPVILKNKNKDNDMAAPLQVTGLGFIKPRQNNFLPNSITNKKKLYGHTNNLTMFEATISHSAPAFMVTYLEYSRHLFLRNYLSDPQFALSDDSHTHQRDTGNGGGDGDDDDVGAFFTKMDGQAGVNDPDAPISAGTKGFFYIRANMHSKQEQSFDLRSLITELKTTPTVYEPSSTTFEPVSSVDTLTQASLISPPIAINAVPLNTKAILTALVNKKRSYENYVYAPTTINSSPDPSTHQPLDLIRSVPADPQIHDTLLPHLQSAVYYPEAQIPSITPVAVYRQCITTTLGWLSQFGADLRRSYALMALWQVQAGLTLPFNLSDILPQSFLDQHLGANAGLSKFIADITLPIVGAPDPKLSVHTVHNVANNFHAQVSSKLNFMQKSPASYEYTYHFEPILSNITNTEASNSEGAGELNDQNQIKNNQTKLESAELHLAQLEHIIPGRSFTNASYIDISSPHVQDIITMLSDFVDLSAPDKANMTGGKKKNRGEDSSSPTYSVPRSIPPQATMQKMCSQSLADDNIRIGGFLSEQAEHGYATRDLDPFSRQQTPVLLPMGYLEHPFSNRKDIIGAQLLQLWYNVASVPSPIDTGELAQDEAWKLINAPDMMLTSNEQLKQHIDKQFHSSATTTATATTLSDSDDVTSKNINHDALLNDDSQFYKSLVHQQYLANVDTNLYVCAHHIDLLHSLLLNSVNVLPFSVVANREEQSLDMNTLLTNRLTKRKTTTK